MSLLALPLLAVACAESGAPTLEFGQTAVILTVNPHMNSSSATGILDGDAPRAGIRVEADDGASGVTDTRGVAVLSPVEPGLRVFRLEHEHIDAAFEQEIAGNAVSHAVVAAEGGYARALPWATFDFSEAIEVDPEMSDAEIAEAIASFAPLFFHEGTYVGDFNFYSGGASVLGDFTSDEGVTLAGDVVADFLLIGVTVTGEARGSSGNSHVYNSRFEGPADMSEPGFVVNNVFCTEPQVGLYSQWLLGNEGMPPFDPPPDC